MNKAQREQWRSIQLEPPPPPGIDGWGWFSLFLCSVGAAVLALVLAGSSWLAGFGH
jgi:hypothetical protein